MLNLHFLIAIAIGALALVVINALRCPLSAIPGPWHTRFTRLVLKYHILTGREMYYIHALHQRYGPVVRIAPTETAVADLAAFNQIHRVGSHFVKGPWYDSATVGVFNMRDPKQHAARRRLFARAFSKTALRANWEAEVRRTVEKTVARIKTAASSRGRGGGGGADVFKWWTLMATDVVAHLSFGESFDMVGLGRTTPYVAAIQNTLISSGIRWELPWLHAVVRQIPLKGVQDFFNGQAIVMEHAGKAVQNLRRSGGGQNLFSQMMTQAEMDEEKGGQEEGERTHQLSDYDVRIEATNLIVAGSDTTAVTLTYLIWAVLKRPELQRRLEEEIATLPSEFTEADVESLPLLNAVIDETLRLYGAAPGGLQRYVPAGGATMAGHFLPAGTVVCTQAYTLHRDETVFERSETFDETRFVRPQTPEQKLAFTPFGMGSRVCLGIHMARMELRLAAALFFRECGGARLSSDTTDAVMEMEHHFLITPKGHFCNVVLPSS
ncbi:sterigmatocystin biosynthesis P450 monooxygenase [Apiospora kogelbergensis]|uniref:sterigmatocystin biosynthesis P450 monooxygenase n=1 Tax=Apiospora kogelbergensis TaxID=1337665 RepID=UPI003131D9DA